MKRFNCPVCGKELIRLEPFYKGIFNFWCDNCNIDINITNNNEASTTYRVGFNDTDETEVDAFSEEEAIELAETIAKESGEKFKFDYIVECGPTEDYE